MLVFTGFAVVEYTMFAPKRAKHLGGSMTKDEFLNALLEEGFVCETASDYPLVVCEAGEIKKTVKKIRAIAKDKGYESSFAIRSYREGMDLISKDGEVKMDKGVPSENEEGPVPIAEPIPMTALTEDVSA